MKKRSTTDVMSLLLGWGSGALSHCFWFSCLGAKILKAILSADYRNLRQLCVKLGEALWSAAACCRFPSGQLAGRALEFDAWTGEARASSQDKKAAASCRTPELSRISTYATVRPSGPSCA
jgi:hypothetical protein